MNDPMTPREIDALAWRLADRVADTMRAFLADEPAVLDLREPEPVETQAAWH
jgi:hypothetical protein